MNTKKKIVKKTHTHIQTKNGPNIGFKEQYYLKALPGCDSYKAPIASANTRLVGSLPPSLRPSLGLALATVYGLVIFTIWLKLDPKLSS